MKKDNSPRCSAHSKGHQKEHHVWSRRSFIKNLGLAGGASLVFGKFSVSTSPLNAFELSLNNSESDRILVLIRLKGGNDGLNTIVPLYDYDYYANQRPNIKIPETSVWSLSDELGMPIQTSGLQSLWNEGKMKVVQGVGYESQNLSHFRSSDIWGSGSSPNEEIRSGWLGRYLGSVYPDYISNPPEVPPSIQIGGASNNIFYDNNSDRLGFSVTSPNELAQIAQNGALYDVNNPPDCIFGEQVAYLRSIANSTFLYADKIKEAYDAGSNSIDYQNFFGDQLALVARLIKGNLGSKIYLVTLDGFDTHAAQYNKHLNLIETFSTAVGKFFEDLEETGDASRVLAMSFSEFGRRVNENASLGTDHGAAAPLFFFGEALQGSGIIGNNLNLEDLDDVGNLQFQHDYRSIYASVMQNWLCIEPHLVNDFLFGDFPRIDSLGFMCQEEVTPVFNPTDLVEVKHWVFNASPNEVTIRFILPRKMKVQLQIVSVLGKVVANLYDGFKPACQHDFAYSNSHLGLGIFYYRLIIDGKIYSNPLIIRN